MVWNVPRSDSLVTVAGLMSTQTTLTHAGSRLPVAIEWSAVAIKQREAHVANRQPHPVLGLERVGDHLGQRAVVANRTRQHQVDTVLDAFVHDSRGEHARLDGSGDAPRPADGVDGAEVVFVAVLDGLAALDRDAQAGAVKSLLDVVRGQGVAREDRLDPALPDQLRDVVR